MAINGISTQQVSGISPNAGVSANGGASIESVSNAISAAANKGITPAGPTAVSYTHLGAFSAFPLLAVLKFVFVSGVSRKGQFFGRIGEQRHGVFHLRGGVPHE